LLDYLTARQHLEMAAQFRGRGDDQVDELLERIGLGERAGNRPTQLSGGEQQRLAFAGSVIGSPRWVLADEPTAELDAGSAARVLDVVAGLAAGTGTTFVMASHDPAVRSIATKVVTLEHGRVV